MKTRTMKAAGILLALTLITSCFVGGTFAKYITAEDIADTARVAKWGVGITTAGTLFAEQYKDLPVAEAADAGENITVQVADAANVAQNVVAPGTKNDTGMTFTLTGTPEVDVALDVVVKSSTSDAAIDVVLAAGTYEDYTTGNTDINTAPYELAADYYPIVYTVKNGDGATLVTGNLAAIETWFEALTDDRIDANTDLATAFTGTDGQTKTDGTYVLTWAWDFNKDDKADTLLGNVAAGTVELPANSSINVDFAIEITVTQLD